VGEDVGGLCAMSLACTAGGGDLDDEGEDDGPSTFPLDVEGEEASPSCVGNDPFAFGRSVVSFSSVSCFFPCSTASPFSLAWTGEDPRSLRESPSMLCDIEGELDCASQALLAATDMIKTFEETVRF